MGTISRFEEIEAWQNARELTKKIYQLSDLGEFSRDFGFTHFNRISVIGLCSTVGILG